MRRTERSCSLVAQTVPSPTAMLVGPAPTGRSDTSRFDFASITAAEFGAAEVRPARSAPVSSTTGTVIAAATTRAAAATITSAAAGRRVRKRMSARPRVSVPLRIAAGSVFALTGGAGEGASSSAR